MKKLFQFGKKNSDFPQKMHSLLTEAQADIQSIQNAISELVEELRTVQYSVCLEEASGKIEEYTLGMMAKRRKSILSSQREAVDLATYGEIRTADFSPDRGLQISTRDGFFKSLYIAPDGTMDLLALIWGPAEIKAFAKEAAIQAGAKPQLEGGLTVEQARQRTEEIIEELERLEKMRIEAIGMMADIYTRSIAAAGGVQRQPA